MNAREAFRAVWTKGADDIAIGERTREVYWFWTKKFFVFCGRRSSETWQPADWVAFERALLAERPPYSHSSRRQARSALDFIFRRVLKMEVGRLDLPAIPKPERGLVVVPTREELGRLFRAMKGGERLMAAVMYGSGARREETCRIRVQDIDREQSRLRIWDGKGEKNRETVLPRLLAPALGQQLAWRRELHEADLRAGNGEVELPDRLGRKFRGAAREFGWQWLFPSSRVRGTMRWHVSPDSLGAAVLRARRAAGIATHLLQAGMPVVLIQQMLGHTSLETTQVYLGTDWRQAFSPFDLPTERIEREVAIDAVDGLEFSLKEAA